MGRGVMLGIVEAMGVHEMGVGASQIGCFPVHHVRKGFRGTGDVLRHRVGAFIGRFQHDGIQALLHRQLFVCGAGDVAAAPLNAEYRIL